MMTIHQLFSENITDQQKANLLVQLNKQGITSDDIVELVQILQSNQTHHLNIPNSVDVCGTGGSGLPRINASTISAFLLSSLNIPIVKHGNKAASGRFGSFDLLESLGIAFKIKPEQLHYLAYKTNLAFCFAPIFHPNVGNFADARKLVGGPSIFNLIGPLLNPANTPFQIIGTPNQTNATIIAEAAQKLGKQKVLVVTGSDGLDEVTVSGPTHVLEVTPKSIQKYDIHPEDFGLTPSSKESLLTESVPHKIQRTKDILSGRETGPARDLVLVNTATVLFMMKQVDSLKKGYQIALDCIQSGKAQRQLEDYTKHSQSLNILTEIVGDTLEKYTGTQPISIEPNLPSRPSFKEALLKPGISIISEVKKASPSYGIIQPNFDPKTIAKHYVSQGARAISVLCNERYFQGHMQYMKQISHTEEARDIPLLCKDFITCEQQLCTAKNQGASAVLLMANVLDTTTLELFLQKTRSLGMDALVEIHTQQELNEVLRYTSADIIGINNRDLTTMDVDLNTTKKLIDQIPEERKKSIVLVTESGIRSPKDLQSIPRDIDAALVGTSVMQDTTLVQQLTNARKLIKICGIKTPTIAQHCEQENTDFIGLNFIRSSHRYIPISSATKIIKEVKKTKTVGLFQNENIDDVINICHQINLDYIQLSGGENLEYIQQCPLPVIKGISVRSIDDIQNARHFSSHCAYIILESTAPGKGKMIDSTLLKTVDFPFILAGGLTPQNISEINHPFLIGFDTASGVETDKEKNEKLITNFIQNSI